MERMQPSRRLTPAVRDGLFLAIAVILSLVWYVPHLGFYSDDWAFLGLYATASDQTIAGYFDASHSAVHAMRPVQLWLCAALYRFFGTAPLGYHLFNGLLIVLNPILAYAIARQLRVSRTIALPVALVFGVLPSYSTDRVWYLAFAITLSLTAGLTSIFADLKAVSASDRRVGILWKAGGCAALLISTLAYEIVLPLLLFAPAFLIWRERRDERPVARQWIAYVVLLAGINLALLGGVVAFKLKTTVRLGAEHGLAAQVLSIVRQALRPFAPEGAYGLNVFSALRVHFVDYGVKMPQSLFTAIPGASPGLLWLTCVFAMATFAYLFVTVRTQPWPSVREWSATILAGLAVFALGYAIFLTNYNVQFTPTGLANRVAIVATLGAAMCIVGCGGLAVSTLGNRAAPTLFAALIAAFAASGFLITNVVAAYWMDAYRTERDILSGIRERFPTLPPDSTLILDGVCPYTGPAIVFESHWDLAGALQVMYRDPTLKADVATPRLAVGDAGITTSIYGEPVTYPYDDRLFAYHAGTAAVQRLADAALARAYFDKETFRLRCPPGKEGLGVALFR